MTKINDIQWGSDENSYGEPWDEKQYDEIASAALSASEPGKE